VTRDTAGLAFRYGFRHVKIESHAWWRPEQSPALLCGDIQIIRNSGPLISSASVVLLYYERFWARPDNFISRVRDRLTATMVLSKAPHGRLAGAQNLVTTVNFTRRVPSATEG